MAAALSSSSINPLHSHPVSDRVRIHLLFLPHRLELTQSSSDSFSNFTLNFSKLLQSRFRRKAWSGLEMQIHRDEIDDELPSLIELLQITSEEQFDRILADAQKMEGSLIILWMANWCRKCIYLKPKLEKLAADYYPRIHFYCVDVNNIPQRLVNRAGITKMPTIQLWRNSEKQAEIIGAHKAWLVVDEVRQMIETED